jgi:DNA-3-methyladenine glycosylase
MLLGAHVVRRLETGEVRRVRIVETEAYEPEDPASHAYGGPRERNRTMFGPPGHLYVYLIYGLHHCLNVVTSVTGRGSAVLLRAAEPLEGVDGRDACRGPGRLARALEVDRRLDGIDLVRGDRIWLERGPAPDRIVAGPRVGISRARDLAWRFRIAEDPWVSPGR